MMTPEREKAHRELGRLKTAFSGADHPNITAAFDAAEAALVKAMGGDCDRQGARNLTLMMLRAVMDAGFMIMHRDELHAALLATGQAGKILMDMDAAEAELQPLRRARGA
jgi:hypothetical protein